MRDYSNEKYKSCIQSALARAAYLPPSKSSKQVDGHTLLSSFEKVASGSDWNDLASIKGKESVRSILQAGIQLAEVKPQTSMQLEEQDKKTSILSGSGFTGENRLVSKTSGKSHLAKPDKL
jgi:hypothetical protein